MVGGGGGCAEGCSSIMLGSIFLGGWSIHKLKQVPRQRHILQGSDDRMPDWIMRSTASSNAWRVIDAESSLSLVELTLLLLMLV